MRGLVLAVGFILAMSWSGMATSADETFRSHVVVCQEGHAAEVGREVLRRGGNAVDAAVSTAFALAVTHPSAGNIGGGGFIVAYLADSREVVTVDFRETAPAASTETMYLGSDGLPKPGNRVGAKAAGVPGTVRGLGLAHSKWGKARWEDLVKPAEKLARDGFPVSRTLASSLNGQIFPRQQAVDGAAVPEDLADRGDRLGDFDASVAAFKKPDGTRWAEGDLLVQRDLADTLDRIATRGADEFYTGLTAKKIVDHMEKLGGVIATGDLVGYQAKQRPPIHGTFKGFDVYGMGPPASGGILIVQMLNILERFDLKADGPRSSKTMHRVTEAMRRAFYNRAISIADPDVVAVPTDQLVSKSFANELAKSIGDKATPSSSLAPFPILSPEGTHTTHLSTLDAKGNAVALTYTLEEGYGSKSVVEGAGFLLNNEMGDFNLVPGRTETTGRIGTPPNLIAPGKRMLSSQSPTIVLKDGKVRLVTGSPGGRTIPNTTLWVVLNVLEFGMNPREAVDAPRSHHQWFPDVLSLEGTTWDAATREALTGMGHQLKVVGSQGDAHSIAVDSDGTIHGVNDRRRRTSKASGD